MKKMIKGFLFTGLLLATAVANAQTIDEIVAKHIEAMGGVEKLAGLTSIRMENTMEIMGNNAPSTITIVDGKGFRSESDFGGQQMVQVVTDKTGWGIVPMVSPEPQVVTEDQLKAAQDQIYIVPLFRYKERGATAELLGKEKVGTADAYKVKLTNKSGGQTIYYIDAATFYIIKNSKSGDMKGQAVEVVTTYADFKKTDYGVVIAQTMEINLGGQFSVTSKVTKTEVNAAVDPSIFEMTKKDGI